jgi:hypothetical protein
MFVTKVMDVFGKRGERDSVANRFLDQRAGVLAYPLDRALPPALLPARDVEPGEYFYRGDDLTPDAGRSGPRREG